MSWSIENHDACLPVTAVKYLHIPSAKLIVSGNGPYLSVYDEPSGTLLDRFRAFERNSVHGVQVIEESGETGKDTFPPLLLWGGQSLRLLKISLQGPGTTKGLSLSAASTECRAPDWILDTTISKSPSKNEGQEQNIRGCLITAHNVVFAFQIFNYGTELESTFQLHEIGSSLRPILYSADITWELNRILVAAGTVFGEIIIWSCHLDPKSILSEEQNICIHQFFTGHEGSVFGVDISPDIQSNGGKSIKKFVASCSDDRTVRIWDISSCGPAFASSSKSPATGSLTTSRETGFHVPIVDDTTREEESCLAKEWGHEARIWGLRFLDYEIADESIIFNLISRSEDCTCQVWTFKTKYEVIEGEHFLQMGQSTLKSISLHAYHVGKSIWSMEVVAGQNSFSVYTGGADSNISTFTIPRVTGVYNADRKTDSYTPEDLCQHFTRLTPAQSVDPANTKTKRKSDTKINQFGFVSDDCFLTSFTNGRILLGRIAVCQFGDETQSVQSALEWSEISTPGGLGLFGAISGIPDRGIGLIGTSTGQILWYSHQSNSIVCLANINQGVSDIFVVQPPMCDNDPTKEPIAFIIGSRVFSFATLFIVESRPSPTVIFQKQLDLPAEFVVSSSLFIQSASLMVLGARYGDLLIFDFDINRLKTAVDTPNLVFTAHKKDAVTSISCLNEAHGSAASVLEAQFVDILTTGRDGAYCIHRLQRIGATLTAETIHRAIPPLGPYVEGARFDDETKDLMLWGFRSTYFVLWNDTTQTEILSIDCGGAHRRWAYYSSSLGHAFLWIKASTFNVMLESSRCHRRIRQGGHGREIKAMAIAKFGRDASEKPLTILATGAEDTDIRFFILDSQERKGAGLHSVRAIKKHSAGLQHLQWSTTGNFLFSSAGREEFYVWRITNIPGFGVGVLNEGEAPISRLNSDLRTTHFDVVSILCDDGGNESFIIAMAYSNSTTKVFHYMSSPGGGVFTLLAQGVYTSNCLTQIRLMISDCGSRLITGSTDGHIAVWDLTASLSPYWDTLNRSLKRTDVPLPAEPSSIGWEDRRPTHQSSIKAMEMLLVSDAQILLITGGDDNCLAFSALRFSSSESNESLIDMFSTASWPNAHASAVNAVTPVRRTTASDDGHDNRVVGYVVASSGNDQRIKLWNVSANCADVGLQVSLQDDVYTAVADLSAIDHFTAQANGEEAREHLVVCGVGMEMWIVKDAAKQIYSD